MKLSCRPLALWVSSTTLSSQATAAFSWSPRSRSFGTRAASKAFRGSAFSGSRTTTAVAAPLRRFMSTPTTASSASADASTSQETLRVALCQFHVTDNKDVNHQTASDYLQRAVDANAALVVLPEIWCSPYATAAFAEYAEQLPDMGANSCPTSPSAEILRSYAQKHKLWIIGGSIPEKHDGNIYNTCLVFDPTGTVVAKHRKVHLFDINVPGGISFFESDTLTAGHTVSHFSTPWGNVGVGICYDIRFAEYAMLQCQNYACRILVYPGAFNMTTGPAHWELLQRARALDNQCFVLTASPARTSAPETAGKYPHYTAWGHSSAVSPWGDLVATTDETEGLVVADLDLTKVDMIRSSIPIGKQKRTDIYKLDEVVSKS